MAALATGRCTLTLCSLDSTWPQVHVERRSLSFAMKRWLKSPLGRPHPMRQRPMRQRPVRQRPVRQRPIMRHIVRQRLAKQRSSRRALLRIDPVGFKIGQLADLEPTSAAHCHTLSDCGPISATSGQSLDHIVGRHQSTLLQRWANPTPHRPTLAKIGPYSTNFRRNSANFVQTRPKLIDVDRIGRCLPNSAEIGKQCAEFRSIWHDVDQIWTGVAQTWPNSDQRRPHFNAKIDRRKPPAESCSTQFGNGRR